MPKGRTEISDAASYREAGEFWDSHDLGDFWDRTGPVDVTVELEAERFYYSVERDLATRITEIAHSQGVSPETLVNLWLQEKIQARS